MQAWHACVMQRGRPDARLPDKGLHELLWDDSKGAALCCARWAAWTACTSWASSSATRASTSRTTPSSPPASSTRCGPHWRAHAQGPWSDHLHPLGKRACLQAVSLWEAIQAFLRHVILKDTATSCIPGDESFQQPCTCLTLVACVPRHHPWTPSTEVWCMQDSLGCRAQAYADYYDVMDLTEELVAGLVKAVKGGYKIQYHSSARPGPPNLTHMQFAGACLHCAGNLAQKHLPESCSTATGHAGLSSWLDDSRRWLPHASPSMLWGHACPADVR